MIRGDEQDKNIERFSKVARTQRSRRNSVLAQLRGKPMLLGVLDSLL